jgi:hypothetical protein
MHSCACNRDISRVLSTLFVVTTLLRCLQAAQALDSGNNSSGNSSSSGSSRDFQEARAFLHGKPWVWCDDQFIAAGRIAETCPADARPYLYQVPSDLSPFRELLEAFEVRPQFSTKDYVGVLRALHTQQQQEQQQQGLSQSNVDLAQAMMRMLVRLPAAEREVSCLVVASILAPEVPYYCLMLHMLDLLLSWL